ncbi:MAG: hypothetical protein OEY14_04585 [Myxococcales bacterium]|nr:hypothetical protein [Myxococcales bacterium]
MRTLLALALLVLSGCIFSNASAETRLRDSIYGFNDAARWGRLDIAEQTVSPAARGRIRHSRLAWGRGLQIADSEILEVRVDEDRQGATSIVAVRWYARASMLLQETRIVQRWQREGGVFVLIEESVGEGNEGLLDLGQPATAGDAIEADPLEVSEAG